jgi:hypothetical protein
MFLAIAAPTIAVASLPDSALASYNLGNVSYADGGWDEAVALYESAIKNGGSDPALHYNLGNAHFKLGDLGRAILNYERAYRLNPSDPDISHNLEFARQFTQDKIELTSEQQAFEFVRSIFGAADPNVLLTVATCSYVGVCLLFVLFFAGVQLSRRWWLMVACLTVVLAVTGGGVAAERWLWQDGSSAVVLAAKTDVRFAPDEHADVGYVFHEGSKVLLDRRLDGWVRVRLGDGRGGWVNQSAVEVIVSTYGIDTAERIAE